MKLYNALCIMYAKCSRLPLILTYYNRFSLVLLVWFVPSLIGVATAVSFVGFFLGPMFPLIITTAEEIVPPSLISVTVSMVGALSQTGSAFFPFIAGALATKVGIVSLQPLYVFNFSYKWIKSIDGRHDNSTA